MAHCTNWSWDWVLCVQNSRCRRSPSSNITRRNVRADCGRRLLGGPPGRPVALSSSPLGIARQIQSKRTRSRNTIFYLISARPTFRRSPPLSSSSASKSLKSRARALCFPNKWIRRRRKRRQTRAASPALRTTRSQILSDQRPRAPETRALHSLDPHTSDPDKCALNWTTHPTNRSQSSFD